VKKLIKYLKCYSSHVELSWAFKHSWKDSTSVKAFYISPPSSLVLNGTLKIHWAFCKPSLGVTLGAKTFEKDSIDFEVCWTFKCTWKSRQVNNLFANLPQTMGVKNLSRNIIFCRPPPNFKCEQPIKKRKFYANLPEILNVNNLSRKLRKMKPLIKNVHLSIRKLNNAFGCSREHSMWHQSCYIPTPSLHTMRRNWKNIPNVIMTMLIILKFSITL
jgi:hypothetical protein